jgi:hypothetical protein
MGKCVRLGHVLLLCIDYLLLLLAITEKIVARKKHLLRPVSFDYSLHN